MKAHPLADEYNFISHEEMVTLVDSIKREGLLDPIVTIEYDGSEGTGDGFPEVGETVILDGRNRFAACSQAEVKPRFITFEKRIAGTKMTPWRYVFLKNVLRRHLTTTQRAFLAVKAKGRYQEAIKADPTMLDRYRTEDHPRPSWADVAEGDLKVSASSVDHAAQIILCSETGETPDGRKLEPKKLEALREAVQFATHGAGGEEEQADGTKPMSVNGIKVKYLDPPTEKTEKPSDLSLSVDWASDAKKRLPALDTSKLKALKLAVDVELEGRKK